jgi:hypothetical protein
MRTEILAMLLTTACCTVETADVLVPPGAPPPIQQACELAARRCSQCHTLDRVVDAHVTAWQPYVRRMRLMPGSGIPSSEEPVIVRCLDYRLGAR